MDERGTKVQIAIEDSSSQRTVKDTLEETRKWPTSFLMQFRMLSWRTFKVSRGRILHLYELLQSMILAVILGLVFFQIPQTTESIRDRMGLLIVVYGIILLTQPVSRILMDRNGAKERLFFSLIHWTFMPAMDAIASFPSERGVITKETAAKAYRVSAYYVAKSLTELPLVLILPVLYYIFAYWMAGLNGVPQFFITLLILLLNALNSQGFGYMIGAACMDFKFAIFLSNTTILFSLILSGFLTQTLPVWFGWAKYLSFIYHPLSAMSVIIFQDMQPLPCNTLSTDMFPQCLGNTTELITGKDVLLKAGITLPIYCYITGLVIFFLLFRIIGFVALKIRLKALK